MIYKDIKFLTKNSSINFEELKNEPAFQIFDPLICEWIVYVSKLLLESKDVKKYPDLATFAFYCRKSNISKLKEEYYIKNRYIIGRGLLFHITPSNVPLNFAYSLLVGLLSGNSNIVRVPSKEFDQIELLCKYINQSLDKSKFKDLRNRIIILRYDRKNKINALLSKICDIRIIWGGDQTINELRKYDLSPKSFDLTFSDRYSVALIGARKYLEHNNKKKISSWFYNDTYLFDQNACTSPNIIFWYGEKDEIQKARKLFWNELENILNEKKYLSQPMISMNKLVNFYSQALFNNNIKLTRKSKNRIWIVENSKLPKDIEKFKCSGGYFNETFVNDLSEISKIVNRKYQTLGYFGIDKKLISSFIKNSDLSGIDRVVPLGRTMDFSLTWDGYNLIETLSRSIVHL